MADRGVEVAGASEAPESIAVVIPAFRVKAQILEVIAGVGPECAAIYVVDDACPEHSGDHVESALPDARVRVLRHATNQGVGGATITGYRAAIEDGHTIIVKIDGDGQMDPRDLPKLVRPLLTRQADYVKGNRFFDLEGLRSMPTVRLIGNAGLSFLTKLSTGYWDLFDPTNGFTAIDSRVAARLPLQKISRGYFFESDVLFRLATLRAVVRDVPMPAHYGSEESGLEVRRVAPEFLLKHLRNIAKRIFYNYYLRNFSIASIELLLAPLFILSGTVIGVLGWARSLAFGELATSGTVMLAALPVLVGVQLLLAFLGHDMEDVPKVPLRDRLAPLDLPRLPDVRGDA